MKLVNTFGFIFQFNYKLSDRHFKWLQMRSSFARQKITVDCRNVDPEGAKFRSFDGKIISSSSRRPLHGTTITVDNKCTVSRIFLDARRTYIIRSLGFVLVLPKLMALISFNAPLRRRDGILLCCCLYVSRSSVGRLVHHQFTFIFFAEASSAEMFDIQIYHENI